MNQDQIGDILLRQFLPSFKMLQNQIEKCPDELWASSGDQPPLWLQIYHVLFGVQVWFGETREYSYPDFGKKVTPLFEDPQDDFLTRQELGDYAEKVKQQAESFFARGPKHLLEESLIFDHYTNLDAAVEQIRHITYHVARINGFFLQHGLKPVSYNYFS